jgi:lysophospholipase L1-like esterase
MRPLPERGKIFPGLKKVATPCVLYLICIHILLLVLIFTPNVRELISSGLGVTQPDSNAFYDEMLHYHARIDANVESGAILFIGDSHIQGLCVSCVTDKAVNFGIGEDTTTGVYSRLPFYQSLYHSSAIVFEIGINDLLQKNVDQIIPNYKYIITAVPMQTSIIFSAVLPIDSEFANKRFRRNNKIRLLNQGIKSMCNQHSNCTYIDSSKKLTDDHGELKNQYHIGDGLHLSAAGYKLWISDLRKAVNSVKIDND